MELNERLDKELERRFEDLENLDTGSDAQVKATENIVKLYRMRMEENEKKANKEAEEDKLQLEKHKHELEISKAEDDRKIRKTTIWTGLATGVASGAVGCYWLAKGFEFEKTGTFCSKTMTGIMKVFNYFRK